MLFRSMAGIPVYVFMKWRAAKDSEPVAGEIRIDGAADVSFPSSVTEFPVPEHV